MTLEERIEELERICGAITEVQNDKADRDLNNIHLLTDFVVEWKAPTESDPTWYRVYKSGWVEQGGYLNSSTTDFEIRTITLPKTMLDTNYSIQITIKSSYANTINSRSIGLYNSEITSNTFQICNQSASIGTVGYYWQVSGQGANQ